jgi:molecular chaperone HtpG
MSRDIIIGKYTLESLTNGMYSDSLDLYREYIQNAVDSIDSDKEDDYMGIHDYKIEVLVDELSGTIIIRDNGKGISADLAIQTLTDIGNSDKDKKRTRGFRGIGRLAGLGYSDELTFSTSYLGEGEKTIVKFNTFLLRKLLFTDDSDTVSINDVMKKIITFESQEETTEAHYFEVKLEGVPAKEKLLDAEVVEAYLIQHAPLPYKHEFLWASAIKEKCRILGYEILEYCIELNGKKLYKPYQNTFICDRVKKREDSIYDIEVKPFYRDEKLAAVLWYGVTGFYGTILDSRIKGIRIRQGNLLIGDKSTCNILFKEERFNGWMMGELHVVDPELVVNARRDYFEQNEAHYELSEAFIEWSTLKTKDIRKMSYARSLSEKKLKVIEADDINDLCIENIDECGERAFIDRDENKEVSEIDFMNRLSWIVNQKQNKTKYMALNINEHLSGEQKKTLERVFDIVTREYKKKDADKFINLIASNI